MKIVGCDLHARQQSIAMLDTKSGEFTEKIVRHEGLRCPLPHHQIDRHLEIFELQTTGNDRIIALGTLFVHTLPTIAGS